MNWRPVWLIVLAVIGGLVVLATAVILLAGFLQLGMSSS